MSKQNSLQSFLTFSFISILLSACTTTNQLTDHSKPPMDTLVTAKWLNEHMNDPDLVILDCTVLIERLEDGTFGNINGRASYKTGHIPSARFADLMGDLADSDSPFSMAMPTPDQFGAAMGALGVGENSTVVLYSSSYPVFPARVWWMLRWAGFDRVALLDGGMKAWTEMGLPLSTEPTEHAAKKFAVTLRPEIIADHDEVFASIQDNKVSLVDAMPDAHYRGQFSLYGRAGHIPGATSMPSFDLLDESGFYRSQDELEMMHDGDRKARVITYCGGGVAASSVAFAMTRLGFDNVAVYMGSLEEWVLNPDNPMTLEE